MLEHKVLDLFMYPHKFLVARQDVFRAFFVRFQFWVLPLQLLLNNFNTPSQDRIPSDQSFEFLCQACIFSYFIDYVFPLLLQIGSFNLQNFVFPGQTAFFPEVYRDHDQSEAEQNNYQEKSPQVAQQNKDFRDVHQTHLANDQQVDYETCEGASNDQEELGFSFQSVFEPEHGAEFAGTVVRVESRQNDPADCEDHPV